MASDASAYQWPWLRDAYGTRNALTEHYSRLAKTNLVFATALGLIITAEAAIEGEMQRLRDTEAEDVDG